MSKFSTIALIVAGGTGTRFGTASLPKQYATLGGRPVLAHSIATLCAHPHIDAVAVVIHPEHQDFYNRSCSGLLASAVSLTASPTKERGLLAADAKAKLLPPILGGAERQDSVRLGLKALAPHSPTTVLVHDAARPGLTPALIDRLLAARAQGKEAVVPALKIVDTIKRVADDAVQETLDRSALVSVQTPQCFDYAALLNLHEAAKAIHTDDAALFESAGKPVHIVAGERSNQKITSAEDLHMMQLQHDATVETRVGSGFDVHRFTAGDHIMLCGVKVAHTKGLEGHSDADVGLHALVDALLGAMAEGDIGVHFPPSDAKWKGADSALFLTHTRDLLVAKGGRILHVDVTIICERPKVTPHREAMRQRIATLLEIDAARVSVKATTTEKLGFTGRGEGIAAQATATLALPVQH